MPVTLPVEVYQTFEEKFGKDGAHKLIKSFEAAISDVTEYKWAVTRDELFGRLASKDEISRLAAEQSKLTTKEEFNRLSAEVSKLATKEETSRLSAEISKLVTKEEFNRLSAEVSKLATKEETNRLSTETSKLAAATKEEFNRLTAEISKLATKEELDSVKKDIRELRELVGEVKINMATLYERINTLEVSGDNKFLKFDRKNTIMFVVVFFTILFTNQNSLEFLLKLVGILK